MYSRSSEPVRFERDCPAVMVPQGDAVTLPAGIQISWLRDQFLDFADALNLDALIEPWRPQNPM